MKSAQQNFITTEKELISIVAYLKEFHNILLGHQITVYTDYKDLTYTYFKYRTRNALAHNSQRFWQEFGPELKYIKSENNVVADALSGLEMGYNQESLSIYELWDGWT